LPEVDVPEPALAALCARCAREGADGLRADLTIYKAASALAAYEGRTTVTLDDIDAVAELALAHRRTSPPSPSPSPSPPARPPSGEDRPAPDRPATPPRDATGASRPPRGEPVGSSANGDQRPAPEDEESDEP